MSQDFSITLIKQTPDYLTFTVNNTSKSDLTVCMSNIWAISRHQVPDGGLSPFGVQSYFRHHWGYIVGSDVAYRFTASIPAGESDKFSIAALQHGTYRVFIDYSPRSGATTCEDLEALHPRRAKSDSFTIP
ncbi:MAG TPA: hypothetical protein VG714_08810 [Acidobacteriaceae bacterium]|nr:hypothetical protein [Acidobacteriaceae bacterium]